MDLASVLAQSVNAGDTAVQAQVMLFLKSAEEENFPSYITALAEIASHAQQQAAIRLAAALAIKNSLRMSGDVMSYGRRSWMQLAPEQRDHIKNALLNGLSTESSAISQIAQAMAEIATIELPFKEWPGLMPKLVEIVAMPTTNENVGLKTKALQLIGYICEAMADLGSDVLEAQSAPILSAVIQGMVESEQNNSVRSAAITALIDSLDFVGAHFRKKEERDYIMTRVCNVCTSNGSDDVKVKGFHALARTVELYYEFMKDYMEALFSLTIHGMRSKNEDIVKASIEFWSTICEVEHGIAMENASADGRSPPDRITMNYAYAAVQHVVPILLENLTVQTEHDEEDDFTVNKAAGTCLSLFAAGLLEKEQIALFTATVVPFVTKNIASEHWQYRDAAVYAFGVMLESQDPSFDNLVREALPHIIERTADPSVVVRDSAAWTLGKICETNPGVVFESPGALGNIVMRLHGCLSQEPRVASNAAWAILNLSESAYDLAEDEMDHNADYPHTFHLSQCYEVLVAELFKTADRPDGDESSLLLGAYEALSQLFTNCPEDCYPTILAATTQTITKLGILITKEKNAVSDDERLNCEQVESHVCGCLQSLLRRLKKADIESLSGHLMQVVIVLFENRGNGVQDDALGVVSALINAIEEGFAPHVNLFKPYLMHCLGMRQAFHICGSAVGVVGDICRAIGVAVLPYCDDFMGTLLEILKDPKVHRTVKPLVFSAFGDIAMAIGPEFRRYLQVVFDPLSQVAGLKIDNYDNFENVEYIDQLRQACCGAYTGILQGFRDSESNVQLAPQVNSIINFVKIVFLDLKEYVPKTYQEKIYNNETFIAAFAVLGDLCTCFGMNVRSLFIAPQTLIWVKQMMALASQSKEKSVKVQVKYVDKQFKAINLPLK
eukprot:Opistho-2@35669